MKGRIKLFLIIVISGVFISCCVRKPPGLVETITEDPTDPIEDKKEPKAVTTKEMPNFPYTMAGGSTARLHRADVAGPRSSPFVEYTFQTGDRVFASPVIGPDGTVYIGSIDGSFNALSQKGTLRWSFICKDPIFSTAAVSSGGLVYFGCDNNIFYGFTTCGNLRFSYPMSHDVDSSPVIGQDGVLYIGGDGLHAVSSGGVRTWKALLRGHVSSSPAITSENIIVAGSHDGRVYAFEENGTAKWVFSTGGPVLSTPAIMDNDDVIIGSDDGYVYRIEAETGKLVWKYQNNGPVQGGFAVSSDYSMIFTGSMSGKVSALGANCGCRIWETQMGPVRATPIIDSEDRIYIGSRDRYLYALEKSSGDIIWKEYLMAQIDSTVAIPSEGKIIVGADNGLVYFLKEK